MVNFYSLVVYVSSFIGLFAAIFYAINLYYYYKKYKYKESEDKTVSIIIPAYNEEKSIEKTILSALAIDYPKNKLEIIVVDDGSRDRTYEIAKKFESFKDPKLKVLKKKNGGKGSALNLGINNSKADIIFTMDADTFVNPSTVKRMISFFDNKLVAAVTPSMGVYKPKSLWQKIQHIEYALGVFLRKAFAVIDSMHVTPGAFSAYRRNFFKKYGGFDEKNITEDLEIALRIQSKKLRIENVPEAIVYTSAPKTFNELLVQRRRWYSGLIKNLWNYRNLFGINKGPLGILVLPLALMTMFVPTILTVYVVIKRLIKIKNDLDYLVIINYKFGSIFELNSYVFEKYLFSLFSQPLFLLSILFISILALYLFFSNKNKLDLTNAKLNFVFFLSFYLLLSALWWIISFFYVITNRKIIWRSEDG
ncbi:glycosyltransferase family 2 protein [Candidatus Woesearchaeota archaeon]|nr:glycosyltransferase family 2 protein [Candidatus Woesearchaeota archaeon]